jgi:hypothetical protein
MEWKSRRKRLARIGVLTCFAVLGLAPVAAADTVNLSEFGATVGGTADPGVTGVTVSLLGNTLGADNRVVRQQLAQFGPVTPDPTTHAWSGTFPSHAFATNRQEVEIVYTGASGLNEAPQVTIGNGLFLPTASTPATSTAAGNEEFILSPKLDGGLSIGSDGKVLFFDAPVVSDETFTKLSAQVDGGAVQNTAAPGEDFLTFTTPVTNANSVLATAQFTRTFGASGSTIVNLTGPAGLLSVQTSQEAAQTPPTVDSSHRGLPVCAAFLVTSEVVCSNLTPGSFPVSFGSFTGTLNVPSPTWFTDRQNQIPSVAAISVPGLGGGGLFKVMSGTHTLTSLTVQKQLTLQVSSPFGDLLNGSNTTFSGTCVPGIFLNDGTDLCTPGGAFPSPNDFGFDDPGQFDETSNGDTEVDLPFTAARAPTNRESIHTPFQVYDMLRYTDHVAQAQADDTRTFVGPSPVVPSSPSPAKAIFSYAPLGSTSFTTVGDANQAGGVTLPTLTPGPYVGRFSTQDARGDSSTFDFLFFDQGNATGPAGQSPQGPPAPVCSAKVSGALKARATIAARRKPRSKAVKLTFTCRSSSNRARVALWLERGNSIIADSSGVVSRGSARIVITGTTSTIKKGTYRLVELIDLNGLATEATRTLSLR